MDNFMRTVRRLKAKHWFALLVLAVLAFEYFGLFRRMQEKSYAQLSYPVDGDVTKYVEEMKRGDPPSIPPVFKHDYYIDKHPKHKCLTEDQNQYEQLRVVYLVKSAAHHFDRRETIRKTWGFERRFADVPIRTIFILGRVADDLILQGKIENEYAKYQDVVQGSFTDSYYNNSLKAALGLRWAAEHCSRSRFYMFVDDDYYVSTRNLLRFLRNPVNYPYYLEEDVISFDEDNQMFPKRRRLSGLEQEGVGEVKRGVGEEQESFQSRNLQQLVDFDVPQDVRLYTGYVFPNSRPHRHRSSKWYIPLEEYPYDRYPAYVTAGAYVLSRHALIDMYYTSYFTKLFRFDDIWMGLVAKKADLDPFHCDEFHFYRKQYSVRGYKYTVASHGFSDPRELDRVWNQQKEAGNA